MSSTSRSTVTLAISFTLAALLWCLTTAIPAGAQSLVVREAWSTLGPESSPFGSVTGVAESATGEIWVSDGRLSEVLILDAEGRHLRKLGGRGEGPGEFSAPSSIAAAEGNLMAVFDVGRSSVELFTADGSFVRRVLLDLQLFNIKGFVSLPDGGFVISGGVFSKDFAIHRFDPEGKWVESWGALPEPTVPNPSVQESVLSVAGGPLALAHGKDLLYSQAAPHRILTFPGLSTPGVLFAEDAELLKPIVDEFLRSEMVEGVRRIRPRWFFDQSRSIVSLEAGVLNSITFERRGETFWQLYDRSGHLVATTRSPVEYWVWGSTRNGDLLATGWDMTTEETRAVRLRVRVEQP